MPFPEIRGLDLKIDNGIHEVCKTSNETSGRTRSVMYILLLVSILGIISVLNSYDFTYISNWSAQRIKRNTTDIAGMFDAISKPDTSLKKATRPEIIYDSLVTAFNLEITKKRLEKNLGNEMENVHLVKVPVLGNQFDVNDLGLIGGITMIILLIITRFTQMREINNLKIAFRAITYRYPDEANEEEFKSFLDKNDQKHDKAFSRAEILSAINYIRRQHHYNFLSMNEIFSSPPLEISDGAKRSRLSERLVLKMLWFPFVIYLLICINDFTTIVSGLDISQPNTIVLMVFEVLFTCFIFYLAHDNTKLMKGIAELYSKFKANHYTYL